MFFSRMVRKSIFISRGLHGAVKNSFSYNRHNLFSFGSYSSGIVQIKDMSKSNKESQVLDDINFEINHGDRIMLFGENGTGKSTMAKILAREIQPDSGDVRFDQYARVGYLPQDLVSYAKTHDTVTIGDHLIRSLYDVAGVAKEIAELEKKLERTNSTEMQKALKSLQVEFNHLGGYKIPQIKHGLGISELDDQRVISTLSGGEKCRVALAGLLLSEPNLLILDEPTNHLDHEARAWVEGYLKNYPGAVFAITHDRSFMKSVGNIMMILDPKKKCIESFKGSYLNYLNKHAQNVQVEKIKRERHEKAIKATKNKLQKLERKRNKTKRYVISDVKQLQKKTHELKKLKDQAPENNLELRVPSYNFTENPKYFELGQTAISLTNITKAHGQKSVISDWSADLAFGDRIVLRGDNGVGKSTFLDIIAGISEPDSGYVSHANSARVAYLPQDTDDLDPEVTVCDYFSEESFLSENQIMHYLSRSCLFEYEMLHRRVTDLSLGQQRKLQIAKIMFASPNVLLLDEPTNHMDVMSVEAFEQALLKFKGAILAISHDTLFIERIARQQWQIRDNELLVFSKVTTKNFVFP